MPPEQDDGRPAPTVAATLGDAADAAATDGASKPPDADTWPAAGPESAHPGTLPGLDRVKHLFGRKRE